MTGPEREVAVLVALPPSAETSMRARADRLPRGLRCIRFGRRAGLRADPEVLAGGLLEQLLAAAPAAHARSRPAGPLAGEVARILAGISIG